MTATGPLAVLVDLDGTILRDRRAGRRAMLGAVADEAGTPPPDPDRRAFTGRTDTWIARELLRRAVRARDGNDDIGNVGDVGDVGDARDEPAFRAAVRRVHARYLERLADELARGGCEALPGAASLGEALRRAADAGRCRPHSLLTGNLREGARLKLAAAGLASSYPCEGAFGDEHEDRAHVARDAASRAPGCRLVVLGDAPLDVQAARAVGARAVLVATGPIPFDELAALAPDALLADLRDTDAVLASLFG